MHYIRSLYIFFSILALIIFFFFTKEAEAKSFEINNIEISIPFENNFDKNNVVDSGFKKAFFELIYTLTKSSDHKKIKSIQLNEIKSMIETFLFKKKNLLNKHIMLSLECLLIKEKFLII